MKKKLKKEDLETESFYVMYKHLICKPPKQVGSIGDIS